MIALDTQILVYAHREDSPFHEEALAVTTRLAEGTASWALPWPVLHEFLAIVTHPKIYRPPSSLEVAFGFLESLMKSPTLRVLSEGSGHLSLLRQLATTGKISGPGLHDVRIAALCLGHGVKELWSADRDFNRMKDFKVRNPLTT